MSSPVSKPELGPAAVKTLHTLGLAVDHCGQQAIPLQGDWLWAATELKRRAEALGLSARGHLDLRAGVYRMQLGGAA